MSVPPVVARLMQVGVAAGALFAYLRPMEVLQLIAPYPKWATEDRAHVIKFASLNLVLFAGVPPTKNRKWVMLLVVLQSVCWAAMMGEEKTLRRIWPQLNARKEAAWLRVIANVLSLIMVGVVAITGGGLGGGENPHRKKLIAFYTKENPSKLGDVDRVLERFKGREEEMFTQLKHKYSHVLSHTPEEDVADVFEEETETETAPATESTEHEDDEQEQGQDQELEQDHEDSAEADDEQESSESTQEEAEETAKVDKSSKYDKSKAQRAEPLFPTPAPMPTGPVLRNRLNFDTPSSASSPPKASASIYARRRSSAAIRAAIADARRAQATRVTHRVSQLQTKDRESPKDQ